MKNIKKIIFSSVLVTTCLVTFCGWPDKLSGIADKHLPALEESLENAGTNVGLGTITALATKAKEAYDAVVASPYTVPTAVAVGGGYALHKGYRAVYPTAEDQAKTATAELVVIEKKFEINKFAVRSSFLTCLSQNAHLQRNAQGMPELCAKSAFDFSLLFGDSETDIAIKRLNKFMPCKK